MLLHISAAPTTVVGCGHSADYLGLFPAARAKALRPPLRPGLVAPEGARLGHMDGACTRGYRTRSRYLQPVTIQDP